MSDNCYYLVITNTPSKDWVAVLSDTPQTLGRSRQSEIQVPDRWHSVSRIHAKVWHAREWGWICDGGSKYGTYVNGVRLSPGRETRIDHGDRILLGTLELTLIDELHLRKNVLPDEASDEISTDDTFKLENGSILLADQRLHSLTTLSNAERDIVLWVSRGLTRPEEIGQKMHRSPHTVRTQMNSIFQKLGVHSRDELIGYLLRGDPNRETLAD
ncbi:MAG TPA: FHA domain-containing protein [Planctomycetaceae bacterium]|nr:FHA domain-containing protein [Planctomycetaceae bacterium]